MGTIKVNVLPQSSDIQSVREYMKDNYPEEVLEYFDIYTKFVYDEISEEQIDFDELYENCGNYLNYEDSQEIETHFYRGKENEPDYCEEELGSIVSDAFQNLLMYIYSGDDNKYEDWVEKRKEVLNHEDFEIGKVIINISLDLGNSEESYYLSSGNVLYAHKS